MFIIYIIYITYIFRRIYTLLSECFMTWLKLDHPFSFIINKIFAILFKRLKSNTNQSSMIVWATEKSHTSLTLIEPIVYTKFPQKRTKRKLIIWPRTLDNNYSAPLFHLWSSTVNKLSYQVLDILFQMAILLHNLTRYSKCKYWFYLTIV